MMRLKTGISVAQPGSSAFSNVIQQEMMTTTSKTVRLWLGQLLAAFTSCSNDLFSSRHRLGVCADLARQLVEPRGQVNPVPLTERGREVAQRHSVECHAMKAGAGALPGHDDTSPDRPLEDCA